MPYISRDDRMRVQKDHNPKNAGELNYLITLICINYIIANGARYQQCNDVMGALSGVDKEFYRRLIAPYEDQKIKENGDVY